MSAELTIRESVMPESRLGKITSKRQLTIPKDFFDKLGLSGDVEIILDKDELRIRKYQRLEDSHDYLADLVLKSILDEGIEGKEEILKAFRLRMKLLPLAVQDYVEDIRNKVAHDNRTPEELDKVLFGEQ
ncbi:MAG: AbrB/MazE/SpoVT family DNA-binding domain-containing protein [Syntrophomonas sp.]|uniref:AbrB/MazE/SpoVT family DNA-binding domain-containing protein n=1 Tax=Syntrophomonas sp. TaxID=2053627 RepID=UPI00261DBF6C|nr:AbrB/MazE/SpoVT family DNA-binding domain-containing protein [Syntrophomonas sp.]MDD2510864.1 AbrB/MazE/SpoVT family DNA-binding domain-containing protein [Syntrophomonas sp.]MDD3879920.1 AbrB/MazE/SpoVT family DNA-binding domain-containing protein [Syntrophomonas sp.]MDD4627617.1 AbrB/MazE/SpoVT family DNA-binding domain-containing protein [Syntrophomonas sp.]